MQDTALNVKISLGGAWQLAHCPVGTGTYPAFRALPTLPCTIPGAVHTAFIDADLIPEPLIDRNDEACRWLEGEEFWLRRTFALTADELREQMTLTFHGLDTSADIWLNGTFLGHTSNAFVPHTFDVTALTRAGENELVVRIDQGLHEVQDKPLWEMGAMWNNNQPYRAWMRKPQYVYGWDWTIWLPTCGIWRDVELTARDGAYLTGLYAHAEGELADGQPAQVRIDTHLTLLSAPAVTLRWQITDADGHPAAAGESPLQPGDNTLTAALPAARLWWPRGMGQAHLYRLTADLLDANGAPLQHEERTFGLRTAELEEAVINERESGFTFVINGARVFCKGANVVPADCLLGRVTDEKEAYLVALAAESNMNMLRVWGGGVYASEAFLAACDRLGLMVWHDFMYACGYYPDHDPDFYQNVTREAELAIRRLREHASVIGWSGNNEVQEMYLSQMQWKAPFPFYGGRIYEELLPRLVQELHPGAIYRASSPLGDADDPAGSLRGDQHIWHFTHRPNDEHYLDLWRFTDFPVKFLSEFGVIGAMTRETTENCLSAAHRDPDDPVWLHHTNDSQNHGLLNKFMDVYFGGYRGLSLQQYILRSQCIQAEILRHIYDEFRARKFVCSGLLFWTLGDSMGIHNWSLIDYDLRRKPAYHAMKRAMADVIPVIRGYEVQSFRGMADYAAHWAANPEPLTLQAVNDTLAPQPIRWRWQILTVDGLVLRTAAGEATLPPNASVPLTPIPLDGLALAPAQTLLHAEITTADGTTADTRYFFAPYAQMLRPHPAPDCQVEALPDGLYRLRLHSATFVWQLHIAELDGVFAQDNDFDLLPGVTREVLVRAPEGWKPEIHWVGEK